MKINTQQLQQIIPVSAHTIMRYPSYDEAFPPVEKIGRQSYFEESKIYKWLDGRADREGVIQKGDRFLDVDDTCSMLGRSKAWLYANVIKPDKLTMVDLSPDGASKNPRRYFIERELKAAFPELVALAKQGIAA